MSLSNDDFFSGWLTMKNLSPVSQKELLPQQFIPAKPGKESVLFTAELREDQTNLQLL